MGPPFRRSAEVPEPEWQLSPLERFNGPRSEDAEAACNSHVFKPTGRLQWGRAQKSAEAPSALVETIIRPGFNGARSEERSHCTDCPPFQTRSAPVCQ